MSGEHDDQIAPRAVTAITAATVCGMFGMNDTTRSPGCTPSSTSVRISAPVVPASRAQLTSSRGTRSLENTSAGRLSAPGSSARASACSAKFKVAPSNHFAPGITRFSSTRRYGLCERTPTNCQTDSQNASSSVTDHCHRSS